MVGPVAGTGVAAGDLGAVADRLGGVERSYGLMPADRSTGTDRTVWGLDPLQLHARYWAAHGVQVVQQGEPSLIVRQAELYLLTDPRSLVLFRLADVIEELNWIKPNVMFLRLHDQRERGYREYVQTYADGRFKSVTRLYDASDPRLARVCLTPHRDIAVMWRPIHRLGR